MTSTISWIGNHIIWGEMLNSRRKQRYSAETCFRIRSDYHSSTTRCAKVWEKHEILLRFRQRSFQATLYVSWYALINGLQPQDVQKLFKIYSLQKNPPRTLTGGSRKRDIYIRQNNYNVNILPCKSLVEIR